MCLVDCKGVSGRDGLGGGELLGEVVVEEVVVVKDLAGEACGSVPNTDDKRVVRVGVVGTGGTAYLGVGAISAGGCVVEDDDEDPEDDDEEVMVMGGGAIPRRS